MKTYEEALALVTQDIPSLDTEHVSISDAVGRSLATPLHARWSQPAVPQSAMDGYAVRAEDVAGASEASPITLPVIGESRAGGPPPSPLQPGQAMRIFTGATMPEGADAVVIQEDTTRDGDQVALAFASQAGRHVRQIGSSCMEGDLLVEAGTTIDGGVVAVTASEGRADLPVVVRPRVAILSTGDELHKAGESLPEGAIYDSNGPMLAALVRRLGGDPLILGPVVDETGGLEAALRQGLDADLLLTTGGVSVGNYDLVRSAMAQVGIDLQFWKVAIKPGKPLTYGWHRRDQGLTRVFGLPGNPVSAFVTFHLFVRPVIDRLLGRPERLPQRLPLARSAKHKVGREEFLRAHLIAGPSGIEAMPMNRQTSGALHDLARCDVLLRFPGHRAEVAAGEILEALFVR